MTAMETQTDNPLLTPTPQPPSLVSSVLTGVNNAIKKSVEHGPILRAHTPPPRLYVDEEGQPFLKNAPAVAESKQPHNTVVERKQHHNRVEEKPDTPPKPSAPPAPASRPSTPPAPSALPVPSAPPAPSTSTPPASTPRKLTEADIKAQQQASIISHLKRRVNTMTKPNEERAKKMEEDLAKQREDTREFLERKKKQAEEEAFRKEEEEKKEARRKEWDRKIQMSNSAKSNALVGDDADEKTEEMWNYPDEAKSNVLAQAFEEKKETKPLFTYIQGSNEENDDEEDNQSDSGSDSGSGSEVESDDNTSDR